MDNFFQEQFHGDIFWYDNSQEAAAPPPVNQSAFVPVNQSDFLSYKPRTEFGSENIENGGVTTNSNKRMIEFLRRNWCASATVGSRGPDRDRCQRHMFNERMRREREKQNFMALHSILPRRTKSDKNSIIQMAAKTLLELQCHKKELERRNSELEPKTGMDVGGTKIRVSIDNPISGVDSMLEVLKCLKKLGSKTISIQSQFSDQKLTAVIEIETEMGAAEVENAVQKTLQEVERD
ncbi:hypothetical protein ACOSP7_006904 [Xanthoceras sorbifolium]|uniref:BHLH domain-containing protein n=1 Tax=Xanthoceras sorbifolium TaxID=99658 RepID=A0ABQ8I9I4_9ROSI|nr:hypothetical protein JRO89_XS03G0113800 [Xanthoceras sorbifolium]